jgi:hypothetical protein
MPENAENAETPESIVARVGLTRLKTSANANRCKSMPLIAIDIEMDV